MKLNEGFIIALILAIAFWALVIGIGTIIGGF